MNPNKVMGRPKLLNLTKATTIQLDVDIAKRIKQEASEYQIAFGARVRDILKDYYLIKDEKDK